MLRIQQSAPAYDLHQLIPVLCILWHVGVTGSRSPEPSSAGGSAGEQPVDPFHQPAGYISPGALRRGPGRPKKDLVSPVDQRRTFGLKLKRLSRCSPHRLTGDQGCFPQYFG